jgi:hypothetical protein
MTWKLVSPNSAMFLISTSSLAIAQSAPAPVQAAPATAQNPQPTQQQAQAAESAKLILKEGTDVKLKFAQDLGSKTAAEDDPVNLILDEDLKVGDVIVAKAGPKPWAR